MPAEPWNLRRDFHLDIAAPYGSALITSADDSSLRNTAPEAVAGDEYIARFYFWRRGANGTLIAVDPGEDAVLIFSAKAASGAGDLLIFADAITRVEAGVWEGPVSHLLPAFQTNLDDAPAGPKLIIAEVEVRDSASNLKRASIQFDLAARPQIYNNETTPAALPTPEQWLADRMASQSEAVAGENDAKLMSPLRTAQAITAQVPTLIQSTPVWPPYDSIPASAGGTGLRPLPESAAWFTLEGGGPLVQALNFGVSSPIMRLSDGMIFPGAQEVPRGIDSVVPSDLVVDIRGDGGFWIMGEYANLYVERDYVLAQTGNLGEVQVGCNQAGIVPMDELMLPNCVSFTCYSAFSLINYSHSTPDGCPDYLQLGGGSMSGPDVDTLLAYLVVSDKGYGTVYVNGSNEPPSAAGLASKATLESRGWTVGTN